MAGLVGSLAMLLEWSRLGVTRGPGRAPPPGRSADAGVADLLPGVRVPAVLAPGPRGRLPGGVPRRGGSRRRVGRAVDDVRAGWRCARATAGPPCSTSTVSRGHAASPAEPALESPDRRQRPRSGVGQGDAHRLVREPGVDLRLAHGGPAEPTEERDVGQLDVAHSSSPAARAGRGHGVADEWRARRRGVRYAASTASRSPCQSPAAGSSRNSRTVPPGPRRCSPARRSWRPRSSRASRSDPANTACSSTKTRWRIVQVLGAFARGADRPAQQAIRRGPPAPSGRWPRSASRSQLDRVGSDGDG